MKYLLLVLAIASIIYLIPDDNPKGEIHSKTSLSHDTQIQFSKNLPVVAKRFEVKAPTKFEMPAIVNHRRISFHESWDTELLELLKEVDPVEGEAIFQAYLKERQDHRYSLNDNLSISLKELEQMNGSMKSWRDFEDEEESYQNNIFMIEVTHQNNLRKIFGPHLEYILDQYELHQDLTSELSK